MASIGDVLDELKKANERLGQLLDTEKLVLAAVTSGFANVTTLLQQVIDLLTYADQAAFHESAQNDTIICNLEKIANRVCSLLNEAHVQTGEQQLLSVSVADLLELFKLSHGAAAAQLGQVATLKKKLLECCPPEPPPRACVDETPCPTPPVLPPPPLPGPIG